MYPTADAGLDLGIQTTNQYANVWSDLINGADYGYDNGWRTLEADTYVGYGPGVAFDFGSHFENGKALSIKRTASGRERVYDVRKRPVFAVTDDFLEYKGRRITPETLDRVLGLVGV